MSSPIQYGGNPRYPHVPAWVLSLILHSFLFVTLAFWTRQTPQGIAPESDREVGIALVDSRDDARQYRDATTTRSSDAATSSAQSALPSQDELRLDPLATLPGETSATNAFGAGRLPNVGGTGSSGGLRRGDMGKASTNVFGVAGEGHKFVYVFDRSGSMEGFQGRPLAAAKRELLLSLGDLQSTHQFQIVFYNEKSFVFQPTPGRPRLLYGTADNQRLANRFVRAITAAGGTRHMQALQLALGMRPDVLFFLTDADQPRLSETDLAKVRRMNRSATIHCIEFGYGPTDGRDNFLKKLARQNAGRHAYVDITQLQAR